MRQISLVMLALLLGGCPPPCPEGQKRQEHEECTVGLETHCGPDWGILGRNCTTEEVRKCHTVYGECR